ncbi:hypothetical protein ACS0TY_005646 [Phlomoides rotata]
MMSVMSASNDGVLVSPSHRGSSAAEEEKTFVSTSDVDWAGGSGFSPVRPTGEAARVGGDGSDETRISDNASDSRVLKLENEESRFSGAGGGENQRRSSVSKMHGNSKKSGSRSENLDRKKNRSAVEDYDSMLSAFDEFASREKKDEGFKIGDMVWAKVKSHPMWPGFLYNEAFATPSVRRGKHKGHVLVAFFGDGSYGWFQPTELVPFEENFAEKSKQTTSRSFLNAVEEAMDELSRRSSLGLACRCRNEFNFWPSTVEGYYSVDVGDPEPGVYDSSQISKARDSFRTRDMLSFIQQVALEPRNEQLCTVDFIQNKAIVLAYRKTQFEEFDETFAQAFGHVPVRPSRRTAPVVIGPSKAALSGQLRVAETPGKGKASVKPAKTKPPVEKDKYLFKRRDESIQTNSKRANSGPTRQPISADGHSSGIRDHFRQASDSSFADIQHQPISSDIIKPPEGSGKHTEGTTKKVKVLKRPAGEFNALNPISVKKRKTNVISTTETGVKPRDLPPAVSNNTVAVENVSRKPPDAELADDNRLGNQKKDTALGLSSSQSQQEVDFEKVELQMLMRDLCSLALNPFHGDQRSCPAFIKQIFLKFRSLVYQKSLMLAPSPETETIEGNSSRLPVPTVEKTSNKIVRAPSLRPDDPTKGGKKRGLSDRLEDVKKKKLGVSEGVKRKKVEGSFDTKKKKIDYTKLTVERKIIQRPSEPPVRGDDPQPKAVKLEMSKRGESMARSAKPTMLIMKFPAGAALPSGYELKAKFARFGPIDQSGTRIFWKTYTLRLVYLHKIDAQAALDAVESNTVFGNTNVRCFLRDVEVDAAAAAESEPVKLHKEDVSVGIEQKVPTKIAFQHQQQSSSGQLKSILKKQPGDEGGNGNGGGRAARVKFVLGGEENKSNEMMNKKNNVANIHSSSVDLDLTSKMLPNIINPPQSSSSSSFQKFAYSDEKGTRGPPTPNPTPQMNNDISKQMLNLLTRCNEVVNNLRATWGYMPYHPL